MTAQEIDQIIDAMEQKGGAINALLTQRVDIDRKLKALGHGLDFEPIAPLKPKLGRPKGSKSKAKTIGRQLIEERTVTLEATLPALGNGEGI